VGAAPPPPPPPARPPVRRPAVFVVRCKPTSCCWMRHSTYADTSAPPANTAARPARTVAIATSTCARHREHRGARMRQNGTSDCVGARAIGWKRGKRDARSVAARDTNTRLGGDGRPRKHGHATEEMIMPRTNAHAHQGPTRPSGSDLPFETSHRLTDGTVARDMRYVTRASAIYVDKTRFQRNRLATRILPIAIRFLNQRAARGRQSSNRARD
jgi:hypothetical protein